jgi:hypothetical protein
MARVYDVDGTQKASRSCKVVPTDQEVAKAADDCTRFWGAAGPGFEPGLTDPGSVVGLDGRSI